MNAHMRRKLAKLQLIRKLQQPPVIEELKKEEKVAVPEPIVESIKVEEVKVVEEGVAAPIVIEETPAPAPVVPSGKKKKGV